MPPFTTQSPGPEEHSRGESATAVLAGTHHDEQKASRLSRMTLAVALVTTVSVSLLAVVAEPGLRSFGIATGVIFFCAYFGLGVMHERGHSGLARVLIVLTGNVHVGAFMAVLEWERGVYLHLFFVMLVPFVMLSRAQRRWILPLGALSVLQLAGWFTWYRLIPGSTPLGPPLHLSPELLPRVYLVNLALSSLAIILSLHHLRRAQLLAEDRLDAERQRSESLLLNVLPRTIAARLKEKQGPIADLHPETTILFADLVGFTPLSEKIAAEELVAMLDEIFTGFDALAERHRLEKIKTIGDCYMAVAGAPQANVDHAHAAAAMALDMLEYLRAQQARRGVEVKARIGLHSGPVIAGVIGRRKFIYDLWGDAVNTASRMESHGVPGEVVVSAQTWERIRDRFDATPREPMVIKGKGTMQTYVLTRRAQSSAEQATG